MRSWAPRTDALRLGGEHPPDRLDRTVDVGLGRRPVGDGDPHQPPAVPGRAAHPAGALALDALDYPVGALVVAEPHQDLVEHDVVRDRDTTDSAQLLGEAPRERAAALDQVGEPIAAELAQRGPRHEP